MCWHSICTVALTCCVECFADLLTITQQTSINMNKEFCCNLFDLHQANWIYCFASASASSETRCLNYHYCLPSNDTPTFTAVAPYICRAYIYSIWIMIAHLHTIWYIVYPSLFSVGNIAFDGATYPSTIMLWGLVCNLSWESWIEVSLAPRPLKILKGDLIIWPTFCVTGWIFLKSVTN